MNILPTWKVKFKSSPERLAVITLRIWKLDSLEKKGYLDQFQCLPTNNKSSISSKEGQCSSHPVTLYEPDRLFSK